MQDEIHRYRDNVFNAEMMPRFRVGFAQAYADSIHKNSSQKAFSVFEKSSQTHKTFAQFDHDVQCAIGKIISLNIDCANICTIGYNTYLHVVFVIASLVLGKTVFLLNPNENINFHKPQLNLLSGDFFLFYDSRLSCDLPNSHKFDFGKPAGKPPDARPWQTDFIYVSTSGSTGEAKVVRQTEIGVMCNVAALSEIHKIDTSTRLATCLPIYHVNALEFSLLCCLLNGGHLLLFEEANFQLMAEMVAEYKASIFSATPQILRLLAMQPSYIIGSFSSIKYFVSAASALASELVEKFWSIGRKKIVQGYGLSEAVNFSCVLPPDISDETYEITMLKAKTPSIGKAIWGNSIYILSSDSKLLGPGEPGEIAVQGFNVMASYLGQPPPEKYLKTGDLGSFALVHGEPYFFIHGRLKDVGKRMGETIALRDLDDLVSSFAWPFDTICVAFANDSSGEEIGLLCANPILLENDLETFRKQIMSIPFYKRPKVVIFGCAFNLRTASGKPLRWKHAPLFVQDSKSLFSNQSLIIREI